MWLYLTSCHTFTHEKTPWMVLIRLIRIISLRCVLGRGQWLWGFAAHILHIKVGRTSRIFTVHFLKSPQYNMGHPDPFPRLSVPYLAVVRRSEQPNCHYIGEQRPKWKYCKEIRNVEEKTRGCMWASGQYQWVFWDCTAHIGGILFCEFHMWDLFTFRSTSTGVWCWISSIFGVYYIFDVNPHQKYDPLHSSGVYAVQNAKKSK